MAKQIAKYLDINDNEFDTEAEADASTAFIESEFAIEAYITFAGLAKAQAGLMRRHLAGYIAFTEREDFEALVEAAKQAAADAAEAAEKAALAAKAAAKAAETPAAEAQPA